LEQAIVGTTVYGHFLAAIPATARLGTGLVRIFDARASPATAAAVIITATSLKLVDPFGKRA
jgi:hypothetical protein